MRKYFRDMYHGGITFMHWWREYCHHQPFIRDWSERVPCWITEHLLLRLDEIEGYKANLEMIPRGCISPRHRKTIGAWRIL
jgi:hypothetical protein